MTAPDAPAPTRSRIHRAAWALVRWYETAAGQLARRNPTALVLATLAVATLLAMAGLALGGEVYEWAIAGGNASRTVDQPVLDFMVRHRTPALNSAVTGFTHLGGPVIFPIIAVALLAWLWWRTRSPHRLAVVALGTASALGMIVFGKELTQRSRPDHAYAIPPYESSPSFPSGHTLNSTVCAVLVGYVMWGLLRRTWQRVLLVLTCTVWATGMGLSRIYLGHHWTTDVMAGWAFGLAWASFIVILDTAWTLLRARHRARRTPSDASTPA